MAEFDRGLLEATGRPRPRVVDPADRRPRPTARRRSASGPRWASSTSRRSAPRSSRCSCATPREGHDAAALQAIGEADLVYLSGGHPRHLLGVLRGSPLGGAIARPTTRGAVIAGCSAGAMAIVGPDDGLPVRPEAADAAAVSDPLARRAVAGRTASPSCRTTTPGPSRSRRFVALQAPRGGVILGIDEDTAVVGRNGAWQVHGAGRVTVWRGPPPRAIPQGRGVPDRRPRRRRRLAQLMAGCARPRLRVGPDMPMPPADRGHRLEGSGSADPWVREDQSGRIWRKQSEQ